MPRLRSQLLCGHQNELWGIPHQITLLFVNSFMVRRAASLPFALYSPVARSQSTVPPTLSTSI